MTPFWASASIDLEPASYDAGLAFWRDVTGWDVSAVRGDSGQFATLVPPEGDGHVRVQRLAAGPTRIHLDLHVDSPREAADRAAALGATEVADPGHVVMRSPGGLPFCFVTQPASSRAAVVTWPGGHRSVVDQVCVDIPSEHHDREVGFWQEVTGRELAHSRLHPEFSRLERPAGQPLGLLLQRLGQPLGEVRAHLDLAATDRPAETGRHVELGASVVARYAGWTVLTDPAGAAYCITDREPW